MSKTIIFYKTTEGKCPTREFLDSLPGKTTQKIIWVLNLFEDLEFIPVIYFKKLPGSEEIWECRIKLGSNIYRILAFFAGQAILVLTHGFVKKSLKIPKAEIERAEVYRRDYINRRETP